MNIKHILGPCQLSQARTLSSKLQAGLVIVTISSISLPAYACQIPKSYYKHVSCTSNSRYFLAVKDSGQPVAIIGKDGRRVVDLMGYDKTDATKLKDGVLPVQRAGKVGYVSISGREVVPTIYDVIKGDELTSGWARAASNNRIIVRKKGKFGIISTSHSVILPFGSKYQTISNYSAGIAKIVKSNETIWVDSNARRTTNPNSLAQSASTANLNGSNNKRLNHSKTPIKTSTDINSAAQTPLKTQEVWKPKQRDGKWGFVDSQDITMITFSFDEALPFSEGLAAVRVSENWGFLNLAGRLTIPFRFNEAGIIRDDAKGNAITYLGAPPLIFKAGKAWVGNLNNGTKLCIDKTKSNVVCDNPTSTVNKNSTK